MFGFKIIKDIDHTIAKLIVNASCLQDSSIKDKSEYYTRQKDLVAKILFLDNDLNNKRDRLKKFSSRTIRHTSIIRKKKNSKRIPSTKRPRKKVL